jgi:hypothetical protein
VENQRASSRVSWQKAHRRSQSSDIIGERAPARNPTCGKGAKQEKPDDPVHFAHHYWDQLDKAKKAFLLMRELYDHMADLKRMAK